MGILARRFVTELSLSLSRECKEFAFKIGQEDSRYEYVYMCPHSSAYGSTIQARNFIEHLKSQFALKTLQSGRGLVVTERMDGSSVNFLVGPAQYFGLSLKSGPTSPERGESYKVSFRVVDELDPFSDIEWTIPDISPTSFVTPQTDELSRWASRTADTRGVPVVLTPKWYESDTWAQPLLSGMLYTLPVSKSRELEREVDRLHGVLNHPGEGNEAFLPWQNYRVRANAKTLSESPAEVLFVRPDKRDLTLGALIMLSPSKDRLYLMVMDPVMEPEVQASAGPMQIDGITNDEYRTLFRGRKMLNDTDTKANDRAAQGKPIWPVGMAIAALAALTVVGAAVLAGVAAPVYQAYQGRRRR